MRWNIEAGNIAGTLPYEDPIYKACVNANFPTAFAYAIAWHETICDEGVLWPSAALVISEDGGHGLFQLTSSYPPSWSDPLSNADYALANYLVPDALFWYRQYGFSGNDLLRATAASFNAGIGGAVRGHNEGDVGKYTTFDENGVSYPDNVAGIFANLIAKGLPT